MNIAATPCRYPAPVIQPSVTVKTLQTTYESTQTGTKLSTAQEKLLMRYWIKRMEPVTGNITTSQIEAIKQEVHKGTLVIDCNTMNNMISALMNEAQKSILKNVGNGDIFMDYHLIDQINNALMDALELLYGKQSVPPITLIDIRV